MQKVIVSFLKDKVFEIERGYAQNYVAKKEIEAKAELSPKDKENVEAAKFNMDKALEKLKWYKNQLKLESKKDSQ